MADRESGWMNEREEKIAETLSTEVERQARQGAAVVARTVRVRTPYDEAGRGLNQQPPWYYDALCAQTDPEVFFPEQGGSTRAAKEVCGSCEVQAECLAYALDHDIWIGIWGGLSEKQRRQLRRNERSA